MVFSYNWLQSFFKKKLPKPEKLAELLTMHFAEVEEVAKEGKDFTLDIDVRPNRAGDCFSHLGIAREIAAITNFNFYPGSEKVKLRKNEDKTLKAKDFVSVEVKNKAACPRYSTRVICDVKVGLSPKWMQERLAACGLRPINNIVDITNYVMLETGQPLHAFDGEKLAGRKLIVRFARDGEKITTLDQEQYDLEENILVVSDEKRPVGIAGIKGGKGSEISKTTKIVVLEAANFNPQVIRKGSKSIDLKTDASLRFEHGIDPNLTEIASNRAALLIQEIAGGSIAQGLVDFYPKKVLPKRVKLDLDYVDKLLGSTLPKKQVIKILKNLGFKCNEARPRYIEVEVPTLRLDVNISEDLIEEIGRVYGYDRINPVFPVSALIPPKRNFTLFWENLSRDILKEAGFTEVYNYSFGSAKDKEVFGDGNLLEVENPNSEDFKYLRPSLLLNLLKNIAINQRKFPEIKIFELGKIFRKRKAITKNLEFVEKRMLTGLIVGDAFYQVKGVVDLLLQKLGISQIWFAEPSAHLTPHPVKRGSAFDEYEPTPEESKLSMWQPKKCAEIKIDNAEIGFLGEISEKILKDLKVKHKIVAFDIDFEKLASLASEEAEYRPLSRFPAAVRDLAVLVPLTTRAEEVLNEIETSGGALIRDIDLFDIYEGEELPEGRKNLAFHVIYQAEDRTLTSKEIDEMQNKIIKTLEKNPLWQVRK